MRVLSIYSEKIKPFNLYVGSNFKKKAIRYVTSTF